MKKTKQKEIEIPETPWNAKGVYCETKIGNLYVYWDRKRTILLQFCEDVFEKLTSKQFLSNDLYYVMQNLIREFIKEKAEKRKEIIAKLENFVEIVLEKHPPKVINFKRGIFCETEFGNLSIYWDYRKSILIQFDEKVSKNLASIKLSEDDLHCMIKGWIKDFINEKLTKIM